MFWDTPSIPALYGSIIPFLVLDVFVIFLRFYTRRRLRQPFMADDYLIIPGFLGVLGLQFMWFYGLGKKALGYRVYELPPPGVDVTNPDYSPVMVDPTGATIVLTRRLEYSSLILFTVTACCIKVSVLSMYKRIFVVVPSWKDKRNLFFIVMITLISAWAISWTFAFIFMCGKEVQTLFTNPENLLKYCVDTLAVGYSHAISDFITDALIILIPIPFIWQLHLPTGRKLAVCGVFLLGILAAGASMVRMAWMAWNQAQGFGLLTDEELMITTELYWINLEITLGVIACCLPTLRGLFKTKSMESMVNNVRSLFSIHSGSRSDSFSKTRSKEDSLAESVKSGAVHITVHHAHGDNRV
ncbi:hypothetical protein BDV96DRAFT_642284 [Lophiotrema nucula]|uniref:Rhodopsin domain-containing protein n=1 Tax=Lophiotrema nucula TaxID=690887 RepID=A0A6A5ZK60_9PLEO|nr:hypothetical protein BDV96DRAFT_642284 [Lophiotrema nucula]